MNIVVISPASLRNNFAGKDGLLFCGDPVYKTNPALIDKKYTYISSNASNTLQQLNSIDLNGHVIIIDEVHDLISRIVGGLSGSNKQGREIYHKLMDAKDCKIIALTGTPIVNEPYEIAILFNILKGYMYITVMNIVDIDDPKRIFQDIFKNLTYVESVEINRSNKTVEFTLLIKPWQSNYQDAIQEIIAIAKENNVSLEYATFAQYTLFPDEPDNIGKEAFDKIFISEDSTIKNAELFQRRILGLVSYYKSKEGNLPKIKLNEYVEVDMSSYQYQEYERVRKEERSSRKLSEIRVFTRQYSNFVFPPDIPRPGIGEKMKNASNEEVAKLIQAENDETTEVKKEALKKHQMAVQHALKMLSDGAKEYLVEDKLGKYSNKMKAVLERVNKAEGLVFIYSDFRSLEGIEIFSRVLNANGYSQYGTNDKRPKYAFYTGKEDFEERNIIKNVFTSSENKYGALIKVILVTSAGAQGLNLKNIRQVHIMEPYWNNVRIQQVIGRAVRRDSHIELKPNERDVSIYQYLSLISKADQEELKPNERISTDVKILEIAKRKQRITDNVLTLTQESAVDCVINSIDNGGKIMCFTFGKHMDGLSYTPKLSRDLGQGIEYETKIVEKHLRPAIIGEDGIVYFMENKKLYRADDKKTLITKIPKVKQKVAIELETKEIFDYNLAKSSKTKAIIGHFNSNAVIIRNS